MTEVGYSPSVPSRWMDLDGPVHYVDHGGPAGAPLVVLVHGLGGSHANWAALAPLLTGRFRVLAIDLAGFGLTVGGTRSATVIANRELLNRFLTKVADGPAVLIGNSMGALIIALQASRYPQSVSAAVLIDPVLPIGLNRPDPLVAAAFVTFAMPGPLRRALARRRPPLTTEDLAMRVLQLCCVDPDRIAREVIEQHFALAERRQSIAGADADLLVAARSLAPFLASPWRYARALRELRVPVMLIHGDRDRLVPIRAARQVAAVNPSWRYEEAPDAGHVPMLELAGWTAERLLDWLASALPKPERGEGDPGRDPLIRPGPAR